MTRFRAALPAAVLAFAALAAVCRGASWLDGYDAYRSGDYAKALPAFQAAAGQGDAKAMNFLGEMYASGKGVPKDLAEAARWFRLAADGGDAGGRNNLGELYANGWGVSRSYEDAAQWFRAAANSGDATAAFNLGKLYSLGLGVPRDANLAAELFRRAIKDDPKNDKIRNWLGAAYYDLGDYGSAADQFQALTQAGGRPADVWHYYQGMSLLRLGRLGEAQAAFQSGLGDPPTHNKGIDRRKETRERLRELEDYEKHYQQGLALASDGEPGGARKEFLAAQESVRTEEVGERLAALEAAGAAGGARSFLPWAAALALPALAAAAGWLLHRRRRPRGASAAMPGVSDAGAAPASGRASAAGGVALAEALSDGGDPEEGLRALERVPKSAWEAREYRAALRLYRRLGRFDAALAAFGDIRRTLSLEEAADLHYYFGLFCERAGQVERAKEVFRNLRAALG